MLYMSYIQRRINTFKLTEESFDINRKKNEGAARSFHYHICSSIKADKNRLFTRRNFDIYNI